MLIEINRHALSRQGHTPDMIFNFLKENGYAFTPIQPDCPMDSEQYDLLCESDT